MSRTAGIAPTSPAAVSRVLNDNHIMGLSVTRVGTNTANLPEDATLISGLADSFDLANVRRAVELLQRKAAEAARDFLQGKDPVSRLV